MKKKYYAIRKGYKSGVVVLSWDECKALVDGYPGAVYKGFAPHEENKALQFAKEGVYRNQHRKKKVVSKSTWGPKYPCIERKDYTDTLTGARYKNRCIRRQGPRMVGKNYKPHIGTATSVPWHQGE